MSDTARPAEPRWTHVNNRTFRLQDGTEFRMPRKTPPHVLEAMTLLPLDYIDLGNAAADAIANYGAVKQERDYWQSQFADLAVKVDAAEDVGDQTKLLTILQKDLETSLNLVIRLIYALGAQPGGGLFEAANALVKKYGMVLTPAQYGDISRDNPFVARVDDGVLRVGTAEEVPSGIDEYADVPELTKITADDNGVIHVEAVEVEHLPTVTGDDVPDNPKVIDPLPPKEGALDWLKEDNPDCGRLLVGQGDDTYDPVCLRPLGHEGPCRPTRD
jgi:hypothetical protein